MPLTQARLKELLNYDPLTGELRWIKGERTDLIGKIAGCLSPNGRFVIGARLVWLYFHGVFPEDQVDHISGVKTDDRIENLREATGSENKQNQKNAQKNSKTKLLGVVPYRNEFLTQIVVNGQLTKLGPFPTKEEAHEAYIAEKRKRHPFGTI